MTTTDANSQAAVQGANAGTVDFKLEVVVLPVSDVDRAKQFYASLGWREDADFPIREDFRIVQMTPPGSPASVVFGSGVTAAAPGSGTGLFAVGDIDAARADLLARGADVSEVFHGASGYDLAGESRRVSGPDPERRSYSSWATFSDPDGNRWLVQELTTRRPGR
jgi:catechol 2,3-dioxygenase-like lactoylglutathione lyase family enzyme